MDDLMIINKSGVIIRLPVASLRVMGRATQGVKLINIREGDGIAAVAKVEILEDEEGEDGENITTDESIVVGNEESVMGNQVPLEGEEPEAVRDGEVIEDKEPDEDDEADMDEENSEQ